MKENFHVVSSKRLFKGHCLNKYNYLFPFLKVGSDPVLLGLWKRWRGSSFVSAESHPAGFDALLGRTCVWAWSKLRKTSCGSFHLFFSFYSFPRVFLCARACVRVCVCVCVRARARRVRRCARTRACCKVMFKSTLSGSVQQNKGLVIRADNWWCVGVADVYNIRK
jgi:hypothetical protein